MRWLFAFTLFSLASAHSWLDCTNWIPNNPNNPGFSNSQGRCAGWARRFDNPPDKGFGKHDEMQFFRHYDQRTANNAPCRNQPSNAAAGSHEIRGNPVESAYAPSGSYYGRPYFPMGTVQAGQRVCWRWPAKNHVAHVGNTINDIEVNWANRPNYEPQTQAEWSSMKIHTASFKDCPTPFDILPAADQTGLGSERRACGTCFTLPATYAAGLYAIQWRWTGTTTTYTSCGDVRVTAAPPPPPPTAAVQETLSFVSAPTTQDARGTSTVRVRYSTPVARQLVVDLLRDNTYQWYGKASVAVGPGQGEVNLRITPAIMPPNGAGYIFSSFLTTPEAWRTNEPQAWRSATQWARANTQVTGSLVPAGADDKDIQENIILTRDGVPSVIATTAKSFDVGVALTTTGARSIMIELLSSDKKTSYASVKFPVRQGIQSNLMLPIPITTPLPITYENSSTIISDAMVGLTLYVHLYDGMKLISTDNKTISATGTATLYPVTEKIAFVTDKNGAIHSIFKAGSSVDILVSYAAAASRTIWLRLVDASGTTTLESSADVQGGRGTVRLSWQLPTTLPLNGKYQLQAHLVDSIIFRVNKAAIENDMGLITTIDITIGNNAQTRIITPENTGSNSTIVENAASAPSTYDDVIGASNPSDGSSKPSDASNPSDGSSKTSDASTITLSCVTILLLPLVAIQW